MELFYANTIDGDRCFLDEEESRHCIKVLRHRKGDNIDLIDGRGTLLRGVIEDDSPKRVGIEIRERISDWGGHPYRLDLAVCPTKNMERYDWFVEKACEIGADTIIPVIGDHSERRVVKTERLRKLARAAAKQSLKAFVPDVSEPLTVKEFIESTGSGKIGTAHEAANSPAVPAASPACVHEVDSEASVVNPLKLFAFCFEVEGYTKLPIRDALSAIGNCGKAVGGGAASTDGAEATAASRDGAEANAASTDGTKSTAASTDGTEPNAGTKPHIIIMIGPEGDFSPEEAQLAMAHGFTPIHLGTSRLRTETAALLSTISVYTAFI